MRPLDTFRDEWGDAYYDLVSHSCVWFPESRRSAKEALTALATPSVPQRQTTQPVPFRRPPPRWRTLTLAGAASPVSSPEPAASVASNASAGGEEVRAMMEAAHKWSLASFPFDTLAATQISSDKCACSGHCNNARHRRHGCQSHTIVAGGRHCPDCMCDVPGCLAPRHRSQFCFKHGKLLNDLPPVLQCVRATRGWWHEMIPCDISAFLHLWPRCRHHPVLAVLAAVLKEPMALKAWVESELFTKPSCRNADVTAVALMDSLVHVLGVMDGCPNHTEVEQLGRGGAARHTGPRKAGIMFGVLKQLEEKPSDAATPDNVFRLGKKLAAHCLRDDTLEVLGKILEACEDAEVKEQWATVLSSCSVLEISQAAQNVIARISRRVPGTLPGKDPQHAYTLLHISRKIVLARISCRNAESRFDWAGVTLENLRSLGPDEREWLAFFPEDWTAEDIGSCTLGSRVSGIFVSMFACLWADAVKSCVTPGGESIFVKEVMRSRSRNADFIRRWGIPPHPCTLMRDHTGQPAGGATDSPQDSPQVVLRRPASSDAMSRARRVLRRPSSAGPP